MQFLLDAAPVAAFIGVIVLTTGIIAWGVFMVYATVHFVLKYW